MVPSYNRKPSQLEFLSVAEKLVITSVRNGEQIAKRHRFFGAMEPYNLSTKMYNCLVSANRRNVFSDFAIRQDYLNKALDYLECLSSQVSLLKLYTELDSKKWDNWGKLISEERALIKGIIDSDIERQK